MQETEESGLYLCSNPSVEMPASSSVVELPPQMNKQP